MLNMFAVNQLNQVSQILQWDDRWPSLDRDSSLANKNNNAPQSAPFTENIPLTEISDKSVDHQAGRLFWIDLVNPDKNELQKISEFLGVAMPTRADREEIEASSRAYKLSNYQFLTCTLPMNVDTVVSGDIATAMPKSIVPVTFVVGNGVMVTIRQNAHRAFDLFTQSILQNGLDMPHNELRPLDLMLSVIEHIVDRLADIIEVVSHQINTHLHGVFDNVQSGILMRDSVHRGRLNTLGMIGVEITKIRESLLSIRLLSSHLRLQKGLDFSNRVQTIMADVTSLSDQLTFLSEKLAFMLNAMLGMISIEQNTSARIFSILSALFLPPMFIASVYGMNFRLMPELNWEWGYFVVLFAMLASAGIALWVFRRRGLI